MLRRFAKDDRGALCAGPEQHRQDTKKRVIADDDVDMDVAQDLLQRRVLQRNSVDEDVPQDDATPNKPRRACRQALQIGNERSDVLKVGIRAGGKRAKPCADPFEARSEGIAR